MRDVLAVILGGGQGARLFPLTQFPSKTAVPIGSKYRPIDIPISNCLHANMRRIFVLTNIQAGAVIQRSVLLGADYYASDVPRRLRGTRRSWASGETFAWSM